MIALIAILAILAGGIHPEEGIDGIGKHKEKEKEYNLKKWKQ